MEAFVEENSLQEDLIKCLESIHFEDGKPKNEQEVIATVVETMVQYFTNNGGDTRSVGTVLEAVFSVIQAKFLDEKSFICFLNQLSVQVNKQQGQLSEEATEPIFDGLSVCQYFIRDKSLTIELAPIREIEKKAETIDYKMPLEQRYALAQKSRSEIENLATHGNLFIERRYGREREEKQLTPEKVKDISKYDDIHFRHSNGTMSCGVLEQTVKIIMAIEAEKRLMDAIGHVDTAQINQDRLKYGAKGANLLAMQDLLPRFKGTDFEAFVEDISIPPFFLIDVAVYKKWKKKEEITEDLRPIYEQYKGKPIMIRSSAVHSEDGEKMTGAGIYLSVPLKKNATFEQFQKAVEKVYKSCEADKAKIYREQNGVREEEMGIVVQERIEYPNLYQINSTRPYVDDTLEMRNEHQRFIFDVPRVEQFTFSDMYNHFEMWKYASHIPADLTRLSIDDLAVAQMVCFARILEKYYDKPIQIEFAKISRYEKREHFQFFQTRPLPQKMFETPKIEFPHDIEPIYTCSAEGICDEVLDVLSAYEDNNKRKGFVIYYSSYMGSMRRANLETAMPQEGAAMILCSSEPGHGHIETLAVEKGVTLLFLGNNTENIYSEINRTTRDKIFETLPHLGMHRDFAGYKKVRIVANGKIARIYAVTEPDREEVSISQSSETSPSPVAPSCSTESDL